MQDKNKAPVEHALARRSLFSLLLAPILEPQIGTFL